MAILLPYARASSRDHTLPLAAFIAGLSSGPAAHALALFAYVNRADELFALFIVLSAVLIFALFVRHTLPQSAHPQSRRLANLAIASPIAWSLVILAYLFYIAHP